MQKDPEIALPSEEMLKEVQEKIDDFSDLLDSIKDLDVKDKKLWAEIYQNAVIDRQNAYALYLALIGITKMNSTEHSVHGRTLVQYIERMSKANDQLLRLADLINRAKDENDKLNPNELFDTIQRSQR